MAGRLPQLLADDGRRAHLLEAAVTAHLAGPALEGPPEDHPARVPERCRRRLGVEAEQVEVSAELAVIALLRLGPPPQVLIELFLGRPDRAVDPLEHRPLLVAAPVGAGHAEQLERADLARARDMRALAQVDEGAVLVGRHGRQRLAARLQPGRRGRRGSRPCTAGRARRRMPDPRPATARAGRTGGRRRRWSPSAPRSRRGRPGSAGVAGRSRSRSRRRSPGRSPSFVPGNRSVTASAMTCAVEWRIAPMSLWAPASRSSSAEPRSGASKSSTSCSSWSPSLIICLRESGNPSSVDRTRGSAPAVPPAFTRSDRQGPGRRALVPR